MGIYVLKTRSNTYYCGTSHLGSVRFSRNLADAKLILTEDELRAIYPICEIYDAVAVKALVDKDKLTAAIASGNITAIAVQE